MTIGLLFWILMIVWFVFGAYVRWGGTTALPASWPVSDLLIFILLLLLGIGIFGWPIRA